MVSGIRYDGYVVRRLKDRKMRVVCATTETGDFERFPVEDAAKETAVVNKLIRNALANDYCVNSVHDVECSFCLQTIRYAMSIYDPNKHKRVGIIHVANE